MKDLENAKQLLKDNLTCVMVKVDTVYTSDLKGIAPLLSYINQDINIEGFSIADKVIGKASALLCVYVKVKEVYAEILSEDGKKTLEENNIPYSYGTLVPQILNKTSDDKCPMEKTVENCDNPKEAVKLLNEKIASLRNGNKKN